MKNEPGKALLITVGVDSGKISGGFRGQFSSFDFVLNIREMSSSLLHHHLSNFLVNWSDVSV